MSGGTVWETYRAHGEALNRETPSPAEREQLRREARRIIDHAQRKRRMRMRWVDRLATFAFLGSGGNRP
jgi:hypothetical protein